MWGLAQHHHAASVRIVCIGEFTRDAAAFAADKPIELINGAALVALIDEARGSASSSTRPLRQPQADLPSCPRCTAPMQSRRNRRTGETFWGCTHYPNVGATYAIAPRPAKAAFATTVALRCASGRLKHLPGCMA
jgi:restriction system protein